MEQSFDIWKLLAGVAIFLLGIRFMEESLQKLSGRRFKLFLRKQTSGRLKAIGGGALVTGILQSSSLVSLMVLAFVGAGVIPVQNALSVILGANLGTTLDSWIVAVAGFRLNMEYAALPAAGLAGLGYSILDPGSKWYGICRFFLGFSFLFIGLGYIKTGMEGLVLRIDFHQFGHAPAIMFFAIGMLITTLIQSSSATIAITLSALNAGAVTLTAGMAIVLGSEIGTTVKLFIAGLKGTPEKKRVALGNFIFNSINALLVLAFLLPVSRLVTDITGKDNDLIALVFFQTLVNIFGIIIFYPLLGTVARFLEKRYTNTGEETLYIHNTPPQEISTALIAMEKESRHFLQAVLNFYMSCYHEEDVNNASGLNKNFTGKHLYGKYSYIKFLHGEIHSYYIQVQKSCTEPEDIDQLDLFISSVRNTMYAAKSIKDAIPDLEQLRNSANDVKYNFYLQSRSKAREFCNHAGILLTQGALADFKSFITLYHSVTADYTAALQQLYRESTAGGVNETEITTLLNVNREIFTSFKSLLFGLKDCLFNRKQSAFFDDQPGFIR